jgi:hypothetical protein
MIRCTIAAAAALAVTGLALARLPPLDDAAKAKAAEAAAKAAWQGKLDTYQLCKAQDRVVAAYHKGVGSKAAPAAAGASAAAMMPVVAAAKPASAPQAGGTPVAAVAPTLAACTDPGPFAYAPADQKPLEASGAHSPATNATSPPSVRTPSAEMAPSKPGTATKP